MTSNTTVSSPKSQSPLPQPTPLPEQSTKRRFSFGFDRFSGIYILVALIIIYSILLPSTFPTRQTFVGVAGDQAVTAIVALALIVPLAAGVFDLSVAALLGATVAFVVWLQAHGFDPVSSIVIAVAAGLVIGIVNAFVVVKLRVNSFIATLGMSSILAAAAYWLTDGRTIVEGIAPSFLTLGRNQLLGVPLPVWYLLVIALVLWYVLEFTSFGRFLYATGANPRASRLAGVRTDRLVVQSLLISALLASVAGVILAAKVGVASPEIGPSYLLPGFAAAFLGSTQIKPGRVNVLGTIVAVYLLAVGVKGLQLLGAENYLSSLFNGIALIVAVALAARSSRQKE
ncbi:ABC transporter permease [Subtercola endophyticus]|uniref:ABC transporter permease n=1 Tax=Subtercola endophyticus TaxID=2895559 RepID=UPI001E3A1319|nr:ABC transporter permease [Subtercola endophyticus]UFS58329.1 ABC transporter permease [Subtercola endophyticus]